MKNNILLILFLLPIITICAQVTSEKQRPVIFSDAPSVNDTTVIDTIAVDSLSADSLLNDPTVAFRSAYSHVIFGSFRGTVR